MATYLELYPNSISSGVGLISNLSRNPLIPWYSETGEGVEDIERLYGIRSGSKNLTSAIIGADDDAKSRILAILFHDKWTKLWNNFSLEYDPLAAYVMEESGNSEKISSDKNTITYGKKVVSDGSSSTIYDAISTNVENDSDSIYGFNSNMAVPATKSMNDTANTSEENTDSENLNEVTSSGTDERYVAGTDMEEFSHSKKGNIGYHTPQTMMMQEMELWKIPFFNIVFDDIDSFITLSVYD